MKYIIGIDEVGRGCLAGDVHVAAFMAPEDRKPVAGVDDSKKMTSTRRIVVSRSLQNAPDTYFSIVSRPVSTIDHLGINKAVFECFREAALNLMKKVPLESIECVKIDGKAPNPNQWAELQGVRTEFIIHGDAIEWTIGAASILAKVARDNYMVEMSKAYPGYGWDKNAGYGTPVHTYAIKKLGVTPIHRAKFCRNVLRQES